MEDEKREKLTKLYRDCWDSYVQVNSQCLIALDFEKDNVEIVSFDLFMNLMRDQWQADFKDTVSSVYGKNGVLEQLFKDSQVEPSELFFHNEDAYRTMRILLEYPIINNLLGSSFVNEIKSDVLSKYYFYNERVTVLQQQEKAEEGVDSCVN